MKKYLLLAWCALAVSAGGASLWQIGGEGAGNAGLALAPNRYQEFSSDGFFVVGFSDAKRDWPYVHPGPGDGWAGGDEHSFGVVFGLAADGANGEGKLTLDLLDTHYKSPPRLRIEINRQTWERDLPVGGNGQAVFGKLAQGKSHKIEIAFPAALLKAGTNRVNITTLSGSWMLYRSVALDAPPELKLAPVADAAALVGQARKKSGIVEQIIVVFKTHFDIGYTDMASNIVTKYRTMMIDQALAVVDQNRDLPAAQQFVWTIPGWPMSKILEDWPGQTPERKRRIEEAFKQGRFVVHGLPFTTHTETLEPEDLVRSLGYSSRLARAFGLPLSRDGKMTDVPEHTRVLTTILKHAGIEFMHIGCNGMSASPQVPPLYWWEGPDGSRVLAMYSPNYGTGLFPPKNWPHKTWLALLHTGDNHGPPRPDEVKKVLEQVAKRLPGVKVRIGRLSDFADALLAERPDLPVVRGDTPDTWIHGPMSDPAGMKLARTTRPLIATTETLNTCLKTWGVPVPDAAPVIAAAYEQSLLYGEHTWGGSIGWLHGKFGFGDAFLKERATGRYERIESSWNEHTAYIEKARDLIAPALQANLRALADAVGDGRVVVFNTLPWKRDGVVRVDEKDFIARAVPAGGYRAYRLDELEPMGTKLENEYFKIALDATGGSIRSLVDKRTGRELVEPGFGRYLYERFDLQQVEAYADAYIKVQHGWRVDFVKPGLPTNVPYQATWPTNVSLRVNAPQGLPYVELEITIHNKPFDSWPEAGWLCLPFRMDAPHFRLGRPGSIMDPATDIVTNANHDLFTLNTGLALTDPQGRGVAICPLDHPMVSLERPGCWKFSKAFVPQKPVVFVNLFNNQWNTNFRLWNGGTWTSRVRIWAVERADADFVSPSLEARYPLQAVFADGAAGKLPATQTGVELSRRGVRVTTFGANPDGAGILLRIWEEAGISGDCGVHLPAGCSATSARPVNLRGEPADAPLPIHDSAFNVHLNAFAPVSFVLDAAH
ncbi:MAG: polysaccharide lyase family protein [Kiritimatiellaeota bacterium]|nr:polysaccharide lyase family protein [Kiritimatiellota bacterium]